jgi:hypothetical protein
LLPSADRGRQQAGCIFSYLVLRRSEVLVVSRSGADVPDKGPRSQLFCRFWRPACFLGQPRWRGRKLVGGVRVSAPGSRPTVVARGYQSSVAPSSSGGLSWCCSVLARCGFWLWLALASWWWQCLLVVEQLRRLFDLSGASLRWFFGDMSAVAPGS